MSILRKVLGVGIATGGTIAGIGIGTVGCIMGATIDAALRAGRVVKPEATWLAAKTVGCAEKAIEGSWKKAKDLWTDSNEKEDNIQP